MKIVYTKHALRKFKIHDGWKFSKNDVKNAIKKPYFIELDEETGNKMVLMKWDIEHDLRVIYKERDDIIVLWRLLLLGRV